MSQAKLSLHLLQAHHLFSLTSRPPSSSPWPLRFFNRSGASGLGRRGCAPASPLFPGGLIDELPQKPPPKVSLKGLDNPSPTTSRMLPPFQTQSSNTRWAAVGRGTHLKREQLYNQCQSHPRNLSETGTQAKNPSK